ncbi:UNVERIFIED_CONTAM: hypothetical protein Slati_0926000 [Sesamum latifolium]|uniref:Uncharacterized protein n=1 Tax=Sesamum latifolium TaxID=2727402 RepID=A0AAW2XPQ4_9LAMI
MGILWSKFGILGDFLLRVPAPTNRPDSPPEGFIYYYVAQLEAGLIFSIPCLFSEISTLFQVPLNQFAPKAFSIIASFHILVQNLGENPTVVKFHSFFMLKKASPGLFYFTSHGDAHFLSSDNSIKEWKRHYFFVSSPIPLQFPTSWTSTAPSLPRFSARNRLAPFKLLLQKLNAFHYDPRELVHPALLFRYWLSRKKVVLDTAALGEGQNLGGSSSSKRPLAKSPSTPTSSASTGDSKGKCQVEPMSPPAKKAKASSGSFVQPVPEPATRTSTPRPSPVQIKKEKLGANETPSLLKEESEGSQAADFAKGLLVPSDRSFLESLPRDQIMNLLASHPCKTVLLIRDLLESGGPAAEEARRKIEELEGNMSEKERQYEASLTHMRSEVTSLHGHLEQAALELQDYPSTKEGKKRFKELWDSRLADFKKSEDFHRLLADGTLKYYYYGYRTCVGQFADASYPPLTAPTNFLDIYAGLADAAELDEEVPQELPESLLHARPKDEALADPEDPIVEDVVPLRMVCPATDDSVVPLSAK